MLKQVITTATLLIASVPLLAGDYIFSDLERRRPISCQPKYADSPFQAAVTGLMISYPVTMTDSEATRYVIANHQSYFRINRYDPADVGPEYGYSTLSGPRNVIIGDPFYRPRKYLEHFRVDAAMDDDGSTWIVLPENAFERDSFDGYMIMSYISGHDGGTAVMTCVTGDQTNLDAAAALCDANDQGINGTSASQLYAQLEAEGAAELRKNKRFPSGEYRSKRGVEKYGVACWKYQTLDGSDQYNCQLTHDNAEQRYDRLPVEPQFQDDANRQRLVWTKTYKNIECQRVQYLDVRQEAYTCNLRASAR